MTCRIVCTRCAQIKQGCDGVPCTRCMRLGVICEPNDAGARAGLDTNSTTLPTQLKITRTHTGCGSCRKRKRKCDESRPKCSDCRRLCLECDYRRSPSQSVQRKLSPQSVTSSTPPSEGRASLAEIVTDPDIDFAFTRGDVDESANELDNALELWSTTSHDRMDSYASNLASIPSPGSEISLSMLSTVPSVANHEDRSLLNHYMKVVAGVLSRRDDHRSNPYLSNVVPIAFSNQLVMDAVLALAANHWKKSNASLWKRGTIHQTNALQSLAKLLPHITSDSADAAVAATLILAMIELFDGTSSHWRFHLDGARRLFSALENKPEWAQRTEYRAFYRQLYHYLDSATTISTCHPPLLEAPKDENNESPQYSVDDEEALYGIPKSLFHFVDKLNSLAYQRKFRDDPIFETMFLASAASLQKDLEQWAKLHKLNDPPMSAFTSPRDADAHHATSAFEQALQLRMHQIVNGYSLDHDRVKLCVNNILESIQEIRYGSPLESSLAFPLVMAGSSCATEYERLIVRDRFLIMERTLGFRYIYIAHELVQRVWSERETGQGIDNEVNWAAIRYFQIPGLALV